MKKIISAVSALALMVAAMLGVAAAPANATTCGTTCYFYAGAFDAVSPAVDGVVASLTVAQPTLDTHDAHTLAEITVQSADTKEVVEAGWTVDSAGVNGADHTKPHLFASAWRNGTFLGYNTSGGFVNVGSCAPCIGADVSADIGTSQSVTIEHLSTPTAGWWVGYKGVWVGAFPDTIWSGSGITFTKSDEQKTFGEIAGGCTPSHSQMGNGAFGSAGPPITGARFTNYSTITSGTVTLGTYDGTIVTNATYWTSVNLSAHTNAYGGPGLTTGAC